VRCRSVDFCRWLEFAHRKRAADLTRLVHTANMVLPQYYLSHLHSQLMIDQDTQSHNLNGEASLGARITEAGYTSWRTVGENIFAYTEDPLYGHAGFMIDWGFDDADSINGSLRPDWQTIGDGIQDAAGHRVAIMSERYTDIGIGVLAENDSSTRVGPYVMTQNFGAQQGGSPAKLLGVFIEDADGDDFYDIGEGRGGITVQATGAAGTFTTTTWDSGGYQMELAAGTYTVSFSGDSLDGTASYEVTIGSENVKQDGQTADVQIASDPGLVPGNAGTSGNDYLAGSREEQDTLSGLSGNDVLLGGGMQVSYSPHVSAQVFRLYQAILGREAESGGHTAWTGRIAFEGRNVVDIAEEFMGSPEFLTHFSGLSNTDFVQLLYTNVLGRAADAGGLTRWTGELDAGGARAQVVLGFSDSQEFINATTAAADAATATHTVASWTDDVYRLYQATLGREADLTGLTNWSIRLAEGTSFEDVAGSFVASEEFNALYQDLDNRGFVELLYGNVLDRSADETGLTNWTTRLDDGMSRSKVVEGFSQSREFTTSTQEALVAWMRAQGTDDTLDGGAGDDVLAGGALADVFVLAANAGADTILDLEAWDTLDLRALNYASDAAARSDFTQQGADVVFDNDAGTSATLRNTQLALLTDDMILV